MVNVRANRTVKFVFLLFALRQVLHKHNKYKEGLTSHLAISSAGGLLTDIPHTVFDSSVFKRAAEAGGISDF
jgi:hypothetical protein